MRKLNLEFKLIFILIISSFVSVSGFNATTSAIGCTVVARVLSSNNQQIRPGRALCRDQTINLPSPVQAGCINHPRLVWVQNSKDLQKCDLPVRQTFRCSNNSQFCVRTRSEASANKPSLIKPYGVVIRPQSLFLSWSKVVSADQYRVFVESDRTQRTMRTALGTMTKIDPSAGNTISVMIQALKGETAISSSVTTLEVMSLQQSTEVGLKLRSIDQFSAPPSEKVLLKLGVFAEYSLTNDAIAFLENQVAQRKSALLVRTLADLYLDSGLLPQSKNAYKTAMNIAQTNHDTTEFLKAESGFKLVSSWLLERRS